MFPMHSKIERGFSRNLKKAALIFNDLRGLTPHPLSLSPLRGEGAAMGHRHYFFGNWHIRIVATKGVPYFKRSESILT